MSIRRVASEPGPFRRRLVCAALRVVSLRQRGGTHAALLRGAGLAGAAALALQALAQAPQPAAPQASDDQIIVHVRSNGVERGEFTLLRTAEGDIWIPEADLSKLHIEPRPQARRERDGEVWFSSAALGADRVAFNEAELTLQIDFRADALQGTYVDLSSRQPPTPPGESRPSLVLSYRLSLEQPANARLQSTLETDLNVKIGAILLRQEARLVTAAPGRRLQRGFSQMFHDDLRRARRFTVGDVISNAGAYGSGITGAGVMLQKIYDLTPDVVRQPTATLHASTTLPAEVEVAVDGSTIYRTRVAPGPILLDKLHLGGGTRNLRMTVTDVSGRRQVFEQPFLFTDAALAQGYDEYSYFAGKRSRVDRDGELEYLEPAWQAFHRYGVTDNLTVGAGGEGSTSFHNIGGGITLRSDRLGLLSFDLLSSTDRRADTRAGGWSARYTYLSPFGSLVLARRQFGDGFRSFLAETDSLFPRSESRIGVSAGFARHGISADWVRTETAAEVRDSRLLRLSSFLTQALSIFAEYQTTRINGVPGWTASVNLRVDLDGSRWVSGGIHSGTDGRSVEVETGKTVPQGEGFGYRLGVLSGLDRGGASTATVAADWRLRRASLGAFAVAPMRGNGANFVQGTASGAIAGVDGYWGMTREVPDAFALVKLGVPQAGVEVLLNNQSQGRTDEQGRLFIPELSSLGRQDITLNHKDLDIQYMLPEKRRTIMPVFRSGTVIDFGVHKVRAVAGVATLVSNGSRHPIASRAWTLRGPSGLVSIETSSAGEFYLEDAAAGIYTGLLTTSDGRSHGCRMEVPQFPEAVHELKEGVICE